MTARDRATTEAALRACEAALARNPNDVVAWHNKGVELRRLDRLDEAIVAIGRALSGGLQAPETKTMWAHLLADKGRFDEAVTQYQSLLADHPDVIDAHETLSRLLPQIGRRGEALNAYYQSLTRVPGSGLLWMSALGAAKDLRDSEQLLELVGNAEKRFGSEPLLSILAAQAHSWRGEDTIALDKLAGAVAIEPHNAAAHATMAQIYVRTRDLAKAETAALTATQLAPDDQTAWALLTVIWRLTADPREHWLADYDRLVVEIDLSGLDLAKTAHTLSLLHLTLDHPAEQSLRGGTQTRGILFDKAGADIAALRMKIEGGVTHSLAALPTDATHPFLRRNSGHFNFAGSWSVRLRSAGHHISHIHPAGWLSSAAYIELPPEVASSDNAGALAFGVPEAFLGLDLPPRLVVPARPGKLVLFPSYFWHGTIPFNSQQSRLTVAFDAVPMDNAAPQR